MKKAIILFISAFMLVMSTSCNTPEKVDFQGMDSKTFLESINLPENLSIEIDLDKMKSVDTATTYKANYLFFDKQKLIDAFIKNSITEEKIWAEGPQVIASAENMREFINIYDGGKSFGIAETAKGGSFSFSRVVNDIHLLNKLNTVAHISFDNSLSGLKIKDSYNSNNGYEPYRDLGFLSYEDALADIKRILNMAGIPQFDIDETYSLDLNTMKSHYDLYLKQGFDDNIKKIEWTKDDECYIFSFRQLVDNIPIINKEWHIPDGTKNSIFGNLMPQTHVELVYDHTGITYLNVYNMLNTIDETETNRLISLYEALNTLIQDYSLTILEDDIRIVSADLCYLPIPKDDMFELVPGWVFGSTKESIIHGKVYFDYKYDVVNAVTGKLYQVRW